MRPLYHAKADRLRAKANQLEQDGVQKMAALKERSQAAYDLLRQAVAHMLMGLGGEDDKDTKARIAANGPISDRDVIGAITSVLRHEAFIHKNLQAIDGRHANGMSVMAMAAHTGCNTVYGSTYPYNPYLVPWTNSLFENAPAVAMGVRARWDQTGHPDRRLWVLGGDGAMYDIGFQALSRMVAAGSDIKVLVLDTQVYSNTGGQASTASFGGQVTKLSAFGKALHGRPERRKELGRILMAHGEVYVAQTTPAHINHFYRSIMEANEYPGPAVVVVYTPCMPEHGIADDAANRQAKLAVESRAFPLFTYDPRRGPTTAERLSLQGNPAPKEDWAHLPDGTILDFCTFARTEGRFAPHFGSVRTSSGSWTVSPAMRR